MSRDIDIKHEACVRESPILRSCGNMALQDFREAVAKAKFFFAKKVFPG